MMAFLPTGGTDRRVPADVHEVDACAFLFRTCRDLQLRHRAHGVEILFDVEPVSLPEAVCRTIADLARAVAEDALAGGSATPAGGTLTVTLRRRGPACAVAIADQGLRHYGGRTDPEPVAVHRLAARLGAGYRIRTAGNRRMIALVLDAGRPAPAPSTTKGFQIGKVAC